MSDKKKANYSKADLKRYVDPFLIDGSKECHLKFHKPNEKGGLDKETAKEILKPITSGCAICRKSSTRTIAGRCF